VKWVRSAGHATPITASGRPSAMKPTKLKISSRRAGRAAVTAGEVEMMTPRSGLSELSTISRGAGARDASEVTPECFLGLEADGIGDVRERVAADL
jgi:hypothetical protein